MTFFLLVKSFVLMAWLLTLAVWERLKPKSPWRPAIATQGFNQAKHIQQNLGLWAINVLLSPLLMAVITINIVNFSTLWRPEILLGGTGLLFDIVILDLWIYSWHRLNHRWPLLWRFHQIHHLDQQLDVSSAVRFHFGELILSALCRAPIIYCLNIPLSSILIFETLVLVAAGFQHSNCYIPSNIEKKLSRWIVTPSIHWVHHHALRADTDSNYCTIFSCWDRWFGSASPAKRHAEMPLGVEACTENNFLKLLIMPFFSKK